MTKPAPSINPGIKTLVQNRVARRNFEILETIEVGLSLRGPEVKSLRNGKGQLKEAYCRILKLEVWIYNMHISPYEFGNINNPPADRRRKCLLHKREITKIYAKTREKGLTLVPMKLYLKRGLIKMQLGLGKGKKLHDKRSDLKKKEAKKEMDRALKNR